MNRIRTLFPSTLLILLTVLPLPAGTQEHRALTLQESIRTAVLHGYSAGNVKARYRAARNSAQSSLRRLWTSVGLTFTLPEYSEALTQQFNPTSGLYEYYQTQSTRWQSHLTVSQPLVFTGGTLQFSQSLLARNQLSGLGGGTTQFSDYFSDFYIEFRQPFLTPNMYAISKRRSTLALSQAETDFLRDQLDLVYNVSESFFAVYQLGRRVEIVREQVKQNEESYATAKGKYVAGLIPEVEVLQSEVDLASARNDLLNMERELARTENAFRLLLGLPTADSVDVVGDVEYRPVPIDLDLAVRSALAHRSEVLSAQRSLEMAGVDVSTAKAERDFRFDLTARYGLNKNDLEMREVFHDFNRSRGAAVTLTIPLFDWGRQSLNVEAAEVQQKNAEAYVTYVDQEIRQETMDLVNRIRVAESRIAVLEKSVAVAQKGYEISLERYRNGNITRNDLALAQQRLTSAKTTSLSALIDYQLGLADLRRRTLWDFERSAPVEPVMTEE
jgi:outer membrane protein TolC